MVGFKIYFVLYIIEIQPKILRADIFTDNLKPIVYGIVDLPENVLHVGSKGAIMIEIE